MSKDGDGYDLYSTGNSLFPVTLHLQSDNDLYGKSQLNDPLSFQNIDPFNYMEWGHSIENSSTQQEKNKSNHFIETKNELLCLQESFRQNDEILHNDLKFNEFNDFNDDIKIETFETNSSSKPQNNYDEFNQIKTVRPIVIKNECHQFEDEINSSPQISLKSSSEKIKQNPSYLLSSCLYNFFQEKKIYRDRELHSKTHRKNFTQEQKQILVNFIQDHKDNPYVDNKSVDKLSNQTGLSAKQIRIFFTNYRVRNDCSQKKRTRRRLNEK